MLTRTVILSAPNKNSPQCMCMSFQSMVLRAAVGDFEDAQIYGTLQQSLDSSIRDKKYFFLPDIRSFALIALEIVGKMCEKKFQNRYVNYNTDHVPMKLNLENVISDEDDEFEAQYCYDVQDTHRMFEAIHPDDSDDSYESEASEKDFETRRTAQGSLANLMDKNRPLSPTPRRGGTPERLKHKRDSADNLEVEHYSTIGYERPSSPNAKPRSMSPKARPMSPNVKPNGASRERCKSPVVLEPKPGRPKVSARKHKKGISKSTEDMVHRETLNMQKRSKSSNQVAKERCVSPDPMDDEMLKELRNETKQTSKDGKKERKFSFRRKKSEENVMQKEAFVHTSEEYDSKKKDGKWLSKPSSILKSITGNDTTVSVFKAKPNDEENQLDVIEEEESLGIPNGQNIIRVKETPQKAEVWDIIDEQYYKQVSRKAINKLKKTVSSESKASLWSFISTPEDVDDDDLDDILECLPGMAQPENLRKSEIKVSEIFAEREKALQNAETKKKFLLSDLNKSKFELIDYYEMLKTKQITIYDVPEEKREMLLNVVEIKKEEKLKREGKYFPQVVLKNDEMYDNNMSPGAANSGKVKLVSFRQNQSNESPTRCSNMKDRAKSAPLKRPRTPVHKPQTAQTVQKPLEVNPAFNDTRAVTVAKRNKARAALKRALNTKGAQSFRDRNERERERAQTSMSETGVKYATIRKINVNEVDGEHPTEQEEYITVPVPTKDSFSFTSVKQAPNPKDVKRYSSFSSNESASTVVSITRSRNPDVSLTSGEMSSLSSQAESDHYETDMETVNKSNYNENLIPSKGPSSRIDSGFDSGSMSSEMSDAFMNRNKQFSTQMPISNNKGVLNSWARNYKPVDSLPNSPYDFANKFLPPATIETVVMNRDSVQKDDCDIKSVDSGFSNSVHSKGTRSTYKKSENSNRGRQRNLKQIEDVKSLHMSPLGQSSSLPLSSYNTGRPLSPHRRPLSPDARPMSPSSRPLSPSSRPMSPASRPMSPASRPMSPESRPMSPNVRPTSPIRRPMSPTARPSSGKLSKSDKRPMSPLARVTSPVPSSKPTKSLERPFSPGRKLSRPHSPKPHSRAKSVDSNDRSPRQHVGSHRGRSLSPAPRIQIDDSNVSKAAKRYRELVRQGVPMRMSSVDASPSRADNPDRLGTEEMDSRPNTADSVSGRPFTAEELYENLESNGFFSNRRKNSSPSRNASPSRTISSRNSSHSSPERRKDRQKQKQKQIPLDELVREKPSSERKSRATAHRSASKNHLAVSDEAFLNQPMTSEESETCSIKTNKSNTSIHSGAKPKVMVDAEMVIDRIFSQNQPNGYEVDVEVEAALGLDKDPLKRVNELYVNDKAPLTADLDGIPLLNGMDQRHIHGCLELVAGLHVITVRDLLPATKDSFDVLRTKLQQVGQLGTVGNQVNAISNTSFLLITNCLAFWIYKLQ